METSTNKKIHIIRILLTIITIIAFVLVSIFFIYQKTVNISNEHVEKFDYNLLENSHSNTFTYKDFIRYNSEEDPSTLFISIPNDYLYRNIIKIDNVTSDLLDNYRAKLNRIGLLTNQLQRDLIDFYADITVSDTFNIYLNGNFKYEITNDNSINLYINSISIGDGLPKFISDAILPIHDGDLVLTIRSNDYEFLKNDTLILNSIENTVKDKNGLTFRYDYSENLENIIKYIFKDKSDSVYTIVEPIMPMILEILVGENSNENIQFFKEYLPSIFDYLNLN